MTVGVMAAMLRTMAVRMRAVIMLMLVKAMVMILMTVRPVMVMTWWSRW